MLKRFTWLTLLVGALMLTGRVSHAESSEEVLQASFVEKFTRFVDWPDQQLKAGQKFQLCVSEGAAIESALRELARSSVFKGHSAKVRTVEWAEQIQGCHLLFLSQMHEYRLASFVEAARGKAILTVGATAGYRQAGVMFNFYRHGNYMRFEISEDSIRRSQLKISAKLLRLARINQSNSRYARGSSQQSLLSY